MYQLPSTSTFAAYGTKAPPDGIEDPYGTSRRLGKKDDQIFALAGHCLMIHESFPK